MDDESAKKLFDKFLSQAKTNQEALSHTWGKYENAYLGKPDSASVDSGDWRSRIFNRYCYQQLQALKAELTEEFPSFVYEARNPMQEDHSDVVTGLVNYQLDRDGYASKRSQAILNASIYGGQPLKVTWEYATQKRVVRGQDMEEHVVDVVLRDQPTMTLVDPRDFYWDPAAVDMDSARFAYHRMRVTKSDLARRERSDGSPMYRNLDDIEDIRGSSTTQDNKFFSNDAAGERRKSYNSDTIEIIEMWTRSRLIVVAGGGVVIRNDRNPFFHGLIPFVVAKTENSVNGIWGDSEVHNIAPLQEQIWFLENAQIDSLKLDMNPPLAIDVSDDPSNAQKDVRPGQVYIGRSGNARDIVSPMNVTGISFGEADNAIASLQDRIEFVTGITKAISGMMDTSTATEASINQRQAKGRIGAKLSTLNVAFSRVAELFLQLNQQFLSPFKAVRIMGGSGVEWKYVDPVSIAGLWDVRAKNSSELAIVEIKRQNSIEAMNALMPLAGGDFVTPSGKVVNIEPAIKDLAESFNWTDAEILVPKEAMMQQSAEVQAVSDAAGQQA